MFEKEFEKFYYLDVVMREELVNKIDMLEV